VGEAMKYEYEGLIIDFKNIIYMRKYNFELDGDAALRLDIKLNNGENIRFEAVVKYIHNEDKTTISDYPLQKLRKFYNIYKTYEEETKISRTISKEGNIERIEEIIIRK
jgi:hypothetical protein